LKVYRDLAEKTLAYDDEAVATLIETGAYVEAAVEVAEVADEEEDDENDNEDDE
jgi:hypothetical protein